MDTLINLLIYAHSRHFRCSTPTSSLKCDECPQLDYFAFHYSEEEFHGMDELIVHLTFPRRECVKEVNSMIPLIVLSLHDIGRGDPIFSHIYFFTRKLSTELNRTTFKLIRAILSGPE